MENDYLIRQKPFRALLVFALPMILGNLFQQTYTLMDSAIVGRYVGEQALAAVGASYALTNIFICIAIGGGIGASVVVSRYFGSKEFPRMKLAVYTACLAFLGVSILLGGFGLALSRQIMEVLQTPADVLDMAVDYLNIYFAGLPFLFLYNVFSSMFNALGKSRIPLYFLIFSSVFNVVLDMVLVTKANMGVTGVAWATLIAQGISAVLSFLVLLRELETFPQRKNRHLQSHGTAANDTHCPALHFTAVHRFHWHDAGAVGDKQLRFRGIGWIFGGNAGGVHLHCAYGGIRQRSPPTLPRIWVPDRKNEW